MPASTPPPSSQIPGKSGGSGPYIAGVLVLAVLLGGLILWRIRSSDPPPAPPPIVSVQKTSEPPVPQFSPPPPPKIEEVDAGAEDAGPKTAGKPGGGAGPCSGKCNGAASAALQSALRGTAQSAQGCYNRALRTSAVSGSLTVSVQVGANGAVCGASISNDSVGSREISQCVLGRFQGKTFPPPDGGCMTVNIPVSFTIKQ